jgi:hypothetical protein
LFAVVGRALRREPGYHVFAASPHVCIYTGEPHPINIDHIVIAIPDLLLYEAAKLTGSTHAPSIGQHIISDRPYVYAPLRPWEVDPSWQHPESRKIAEWRKGKRPEFPKVWSGYLNEQ